MAQPMSSSEPTTLAGYTQAKPLALEAAGADPVEVLRAAQVEQAHSRFLVDAGPRPE